MRHNRRNPGFILIFLVFFIGFNILFDSSTSTNTVFFNFLPIIILVFVLPAIIKNVKKPDNEGSYQQTQQSTMRRHKKETMECEYCGHINEKGREYCENCGAAQLPY